MLKSLVVLGCCVLSLVSGGRVLQVREHDLEEVQDLLDLLRKPRQPERYTNDEYVNKMKQKTKGRLNSFSWHNCGDVTKESFDLLNLTIAPDPIKLPGTLTMSFSSVNKAKLISPLKASVTIKKRIFGTWIEIPCVDDFGSCNYADLCAIIPQPEQCPEPFIKAKIPCKCPVDVGNYTLPTSKFEIDVSFLPSGEYNGKIDVSMNSQSVGCYEVFLTFD